jgi:hypothetical protein
VQDGGLGCAVAVGALGTEGADTDAGDAAGDDDACGLLLGGALAEERSESVVNAMSAAVSLFRSILLPLPWSYM